MCKQRKPLALYYHKSCGYCHWVLDEMQTLAVENVVLCDIREFPEFALELRTKGGKQQVPCLRISRDKEEDEWLYESRLIVKFFKENKDSIAS